MKTFCAFLLALIFVAMVSGLFGGMILLLSTAVWPVNPVTAFISGVLGTAIGSSIISKAID